MYCLVAKMIEKTQCAITKLERSYASFEKTGWNPHEQNVVDRMLHRKYKKKEEKYHGHKDYHYKEY